MSKFTFVKKEDDSEEISGGNGGAKRDTVKFVY